MALMLLWENLSRELLGNRICPNPAFLDTGKVVLPGSCVLLRAANLNGLPGGKDCFWRAALGKETALGVSQKMVR